MLLFSLPAHQPLRRDRGVPIRNSFGRADNWGLNREVCVGRPMTRKRQLTLVNLTDGVMDSPFHKEGLAKKDLNTKSVYRIGRGMREITKI
jgi:hypothetical protein